MPEVTPAPAPAGKLSWIHSDPRGLNEAFRAAYARAQRREWSRDDASVADQRALLLYSFATMAALSPNPPRLTAFAGGSTAWGVSATQPATREDNREVQKWIAFGAIALMGGIQAFDREQVQMLGANVKVETEGGSLASGPHPDTAFPVVIGVVAIVSLATGLAATTALYFSQRNEIDASKVASDERVQKHAAALAAATNIVDTHIDREQAKGETLPWDAQELALLETLKGTTKELARTEPAPLQSVPDLGAVSAGAGKALEGIGAGATAAGTTFGVGGLVVAGLGLWLLAEKAQGYRQRAAA